LVGAFLDGAVQDVLASLISPCARCLKPGHGLSPNIESFQELSIGFTCPAVASDDVATHDFAEQRWWAARKLWGRHSFVIMLNAVQIQKLNSQRLA
jgi:hypothetical protein